MSFTKYDLCNLALAEIRVPGIGSFTDGTTQSDVAGQVYDMLLLQHLGLHRWRFATAEWPLVASPAVPLDARWSIFHPLPNDCLLVHTVTLNGKPVIYDVQQRQIASNMVASDQPTLEGTVKMDEQYFPPYFQAVVSARLEVAFAGGIAGKADMKELALTKFEKVLKDAKRIDSQTRTAPGKTPSSLVSYR
jgi:hypothetical protein